MIFITKKDILSRVNFTEKEWNEVADYRRMAEGQHFRHFDEELKRLNDRKTLEEDYVFMIEEHNMNPSTELDSFIIAYLNLGYEESKSAMDRTIEQAKNQLRMLNAERNWLLRTWDD